MSPTVLTSLLLASHPSSISNVAGFPTFASVYSVACFPSLVLVTSFVGILSAPVLMLASLLLLDGVVDVPAISVADVAADLQETFQN